MVSVERIKEYAEIDNDVSFKINISHITMVSYVNVKQLGGRVSHYMVCMCIYAGKNVCYV